MRILTKHRNYQAFVSFLVDDDLVAGATLKRPYRNLASSRLHPVVCSCNDIVRKEHAARKARAMPEVEIYSSRTCGFCHMAKRLFLSKSVQFKEYDVTLDPRKRVEMQQRSKAGRTVPQIFIGGTYIGGCTDLYELDRRSKLDSLLRADQKF